MPANTHTEAPADGRTMSLPPGWSIGDRIAYHDCWNHDYQVGSATHSREYQALVQRQRDTEGTVPGTAGIFNLAQHWRRGYSRTQVSLASLQIVTNEYPGRGVPMAPGPRPARTRTGSDPNGRMPGEPGFNLNATPRGYSPGVCRCADCVGAYVSQNGLTWQRDGYAISRYVAPLVGNHSWSQTAHVAYGYGSPPPGHARPPSRWQGNEEETMLPVSLLDLINHPLRYMLRRSGRVWSAEVEINDLDVRAASRILGVERANYSHRPDRPCIVASGDATVDAEIKVSCMRDGSGSHAQMALNAYRKLHEAGATTHTNAGHHVHVDGTRLADMGTDAVDSVISAAWIFAFACQRALTPMAASGYSSHRGQSGFRPDRNEMGQKGYLSSRRALHSERLWYAASSGSDSIATMEYRLPNGTVQPLRAQSYIATALGLLDFGERATIDGDEKAALFLRQATDRVEHGHLYSQEDASQLVLEALNYSRDAKKALAVATFTAPMSDASKRMFEEAAELPSPLAKAFEEAQAEPKKAKATKAKASRTAAYERIMAQVSTNAANTVWATTAAAALAPQYFFRDDDTVEEAPEVDDGI